MVDQYRSRWTIEEYNAALKSGSAYEARHFESRDGLLTILAMSLPIACEMLWLRSRARCTPKAPATEVLTPIQLQVLNALGPFPMPEQPTVRDALLAACALGGHVKANGEPGRLATTRADPHREVSAPFDGEYTSTFGTGPCFRRKQRKTLI